MTFECAESKEKLTSLGKDPLPQDSLIAKYLKQSLGILKYTNYFVINLDTSHDIVLSIFMKVNGHTKVIGVTEDKWQGENHLKFMRMNDGRRWEEFINIPIMELAETLEKIDSLISTRLLQ